MSNHVAKLLSVVAILSSSLTGIANANAGWGNCNVRQSVPVKPQTATPPVIERVVYKLVQQTPQYDLRRPQVVSGATTTLFANFLRQEPGYVMFNLNGTSTECNVIEWRPNSVTVELPRLGLLEPKNAEIQILLPCGRIAKTFPVLYVSQPDIVVHEESIPLPMPPAPTSRPAVYATPVQGGMILQSGGE